MTIRVLLSSFALAFAAMSFVPASAEAAVCARGAYRAGCAGPNGAVVARKPATTCRYVNGVRVCKRYW